MSRITQAFEKRKGRGVLVAYITGGDPTLEVTEALVPVLASAGADVVELGMPFSDPLLDGPTIQHSAQRALENGATPSGVLGVVRRLRDNGYEVPIALMTCTNLVARPGFDRFAKDCAKAGVDGLIVTDLPPEEAAEWKTSADANGLDTIFLLAPTSTDDRIEAVAKLSTGFIYCVSRAGVTGAQQSGPPDLPPLIARIREHTLTPIGVGFGISAPEHVRAVWDVAEGAVVGSAIVNIIASGGEDMPRRVADFTHNLKSEEKT